MQTITIVCVPGSHVIDAPRDIVITREVPNTLVISLVGQDGATIDTTAVATWEFGITRGFLGAQSLLAGVSGITGNGTGPVITIDTHTEEMAAYLTGKYSAVGYATLKGYDSTGAAKMSYTFPVTLQNVGYDDTVADTAALDGLAYTKTAVDAKFAAVGNAIPAATESSRGTIALATAEEATAGTDPNKAITPATLGAVLEDAIPVIPPIPADLSDLSDTTGILTGKEPVTNKTQAIDAVTPSADKYTSEAAVVSYVAGLIPDVPDDLSELTDTTGILAGKVDKVTDKALSTNDYTSDDKAAVGKIELETLTELTGADVTVAPWTQSVWSASGVCSLTATGWAVSGHQVAYILITLAAEATPSVIGATVADDDALSAAGTYACYLINENGTVRFKVAGFTEAA